MSLVAPTVPSCLLACLEIYRGTATPSVLLPLGYTGFAIHIYIIPDQYHRADRAAISSISVDEMWGKYLEICKEITESFIPKKRKKNNSDPSYYNSRVKSLKEKHAEHTTNISKVKSRRKR
jgi:hypothetical protein